jgi:hypothetical protein
LSLLLIEDDRADAVLVEELIADSVADIRMARCGDPGTDR